MRLLPQKPLCIWSRILCACLALLCFNIIALAGDTPRSTAGMLVAVNAASYQPRIAPGGIAAAFGTQMTEQTAMADRQPLPLEIGQVGVRLIDSAGQPFTAPLFFVSPNQINFLVPDQIATGQARIFLTNGADLIAQGQVIISNAAPALFTFTGNGKGIPAGMTTYDGEAYASVIHQDGTPRPIASGNAHRPQYLLLFGTGFRYAYNVKVKLGNTIIKPVYAGAQGALSGLDQINLIIPPDINPGLLELVIISDGYASNPVQVQIGEPAKSTSTDSVR